MTRVVGSNNLFNSYKNTVEEKMIIMIRTLLRDMKILSKHKKVIIRFLSSLNQTQL